MQATPHIRCVTAPYEDKASKQMPCIVGTVAQADSARAVSGPGRLPPREPPRERRPLLAPERSPFCCEDSWRVASPDCSAPLRAVVSASRSAGTLAPLPLPLPLPLPAPLDPLRLRRALRARRFGKL